MRSSTMKIFTTLSVAVIASAAAVDNSMALVMRTEQQSSSNHTDVVSESYVSDCEFMTDTIKYEGFGNTPIVQPLTQDIGGTFVYE